MEWTCRSKNVMDTLAAPYFQAAAYEALQANPNYSDMGLEEQKKGIR